VRAIFWWRLVLPWQIKLRLFTIFLGGGRYRESYQKLFFFCLLLLGSINEVSAMNEGSSFLDVDASTVVDEIVQQFGNPLKNLPASAQDYSVLSQQINQQFQGRINFQVIKKLNETYNDVKFIYYDRKLFVLSPNAFEKINKICDLVRRNRQAGLLTQQTLGQITVQAASILQADVESEALHEQDIEILNLLLKKFGVDLDAANNLNLRSLCGRWFCNPHCCVGVFGISMLLLGLIIYLICSANPEA